MSEPTQPCAELHIAGVSERDIDLLVLEEFLATQSFRDWFGAACGVAGGLGTFVRARRSVPDITGETDVEVEFLSPDCGVVLLLIENKIGASLQPQQAERYQARGQRFIELGRCHKFRTVLLAPRAYFSDETQVKGFDHRLEYESLVAWFEGEAAVGDRRVYKLALLQSAIRKATLGYEPTTDGAATAFWLAYWERALQLAPELEMRQPGGKPLGSSFVGFSPPGLREVKCDIVHKLSYGFVDLQLRGRGDRLNAVRSLLQSNVTSDMSFHRANKSAAVRINVPKLDVSKAFESQREAAEVGVRAAKQLLDWAVQSKHLLATTL